MGGSSSKSTTVPSPSQRNNQFYSYSYSSNPRTSTTPYRSTIPDNYTVTATTTAKPNIYANTTNVNSVNATTATKPNIYATTTNVNKVNPTTTAKPNIYATTTNVNSTTLTKPNIYATTTNVNKVNVTTPTKPNIYGNSTNANHVKPFRRILSDGYQVNATTTTKPRVYPNNTNVNNVVKRSTSTLSDGYNVNAIAKPLVYPDTSNAKTYRSRNQTNINKTRAKKSNSRSTDFSVNTEYTRNNTNNQTFGKRGNNNNRNRDEDDATGFVMHYINGKEIRIPTSEVKMPTGKIVAVTRPGKPRCFCKTQNESKLVPIRDNGRPGSEDYAIIVAELNDTVQRHVSGSFSRIQVFSIHKVKNCCLWMRYCTRQRDMVKEGWDKEERMLFHGSQSVDDIIKTGFDERHSNQSGMFGAGIYFAEHSSKSNQYVYGYMGRNGCQMHQDAMCTICERKMLLCRVSLGKTQVMTHANKMAHAPPGYHSVSGLAGYGLQYPEYVVYRGEQAYPEYVIKYKIVI